MKTEKEEIQREAIKKLDDSRSDLRILTDFKEETELLKLSRKETTLPQIVIQKGNYQPTIDVPFYVVEVWLKQRIESINKEIVELEKLFK